MPEIYNAVPRFDITSAAGADYDEPGEVVHATIYELDALGALKEFCSRHGFKYQIVGEPTEFRALVDTPHERFVATVTND